VSEEQKSGGGKRSRQQQNQQQQEGSPVVGDPRVESDESGNTKVHLADIGDTLTSHGDGTPTIAPDLQERAQKEAEFNADPDRDNREVARRLGADV
jgi:hypothetical protein